MCIAATGQTSGSSSRSISFWGAFDGLSREVYPLARRMRTRLGIRGGEVSMRRGNCCRIQFAVAVDIDASAFLPGLNAVGVLNCWLRQIIVYTDQCFNASSM